jgi:SAM-dependent methyltransferase
MTFIDRRDAVALRRHYEIEKELADRLRAAEPGQRQDLYRTVYDELFRRVPDHPQNVWKEGPEEQVKRTAEQMRILQPFLRPESVYVEIGCGDGHLARTVARQVRLSYGVDVSPVITATESSPSNYSALYCRDGVTIPLADGVATVVYSNMLLEHLHPQDAVRHLDEVFRVLRPGGVYVCRTPHRYTGPQDISQFFDAEATGLHLKEYTIRELRQVFGAVGFVPVQLKVRLKGRSVPLMTPVLTVAESVLGLLPHGARKAVCRSMFLWPLFSTITVAAYKPLPVPARVIDTSRMFTLALA